MPVQITRGTSDPVMDQIAAALDQYLAAHPAARVEMYRQNQVSIHVRVVDPAFSGVKRGDRGDEIWSLLYQLPEDVVADVSVLILVAPEEVHTSPSSREFDDPIPSLI